MPAKVARRGREALSEGWECLGWVGWTSRGDGSVGKPSWMAGWG